MEIFGTGTKIKASDFRGGYNSSKFSKKLKNIPKNLLNTSERKYLYNELAKRGKEGAGLSRYETQGVIRKVIDDKSDNISRTEAIKLEKHLEETTGYKNLNWGSSAAKKYSLLETSESKKTSTMPSSAIKNPGSGIDQAEQNLGTQKESALGAPIANLSTTNGKKNNFLSFFTRNKKNQDFANIRKHDPASPQTPLDDSRTKDASPNSSQENNDLKKFANTDINTDINKISSPKENAPLTQSIDHTSSINREINLEQNLSANSNKENLSLDEKNDIFNESDVATATPEDLDYTKFKQSLKKNFPKQENKTSEDTGAKDTSIESNNLTQEKPEAEIEAGITDQDHAEQNHTEPSAQTIQSNYQEKSEKEEEPIETNRIAEVEIEEKDAQHKTSNSDQKIPAQNTFNIAPPKVDPHTRDVEASEVGFYAKQKTFTDEIKIKKEKMNEEKKRLYSVTLLLISRQKSAGMINQVLTDYGHLFLGRMGIPLAKGCTENCSSVITLIANASKEEFSQLEQAASAIDGVVIKSILLPITE